MEDLIFDLDKWDDPADKANIIMTFIVNRAAMFNTFNYSRICADIDDTERGCVIYNAIFAIAPYIHLPFFTNRSASNARFWMNNKLIKRKLFYKKLREADGTMLWGEGGVDILAGISDEYIHLIATQLYGWVITC